MLLLFISGAEHSLDGQQLCVKQRSVFMNKIIEIQFFTLLLLPYIIEKF